MGKTTSRPKQQKEKVEAFVRAALAKTSKKPVSEKTVREVAKKISKAFPQHINA